MQMDNTRMARGLAIVKDDSAIQKLSGKSRYLVRSQNGEKWYNVQKIHYKWFCDCPDYKHRKVHCKHIYAIEYSLKLKKIVEDKAEPKPIDNTFKPFRCPKCHSNDVFKNGWRETGRGKIQRFKCKECKNRFIIDKGFNQMKNDPHCILASVDLFFKGLSYRKIADHLGQFYNVKVSQTTPMRWVKKYLELLGDYAEQHQPEVGMMWHSDEMKVKVKGEWKWVWNVMDNETRFLLACNISDSRNVKDARKLIKEAKDNAGKRPKVFITDGLKSYPQALVKEFGQGTLRSRHHRYRDFQHAPNNNIVERLNGTVRERLKVMRGLENVQSTEQLLAGFQTYYNYLREHQSLGQTPAMASGIDLNLGVNKLESMIELIANQRQFG